MKIDTALKITVHEGVYPPAEDSYFLIKCIQVGKEKILDMGTGTGIIALHMAQHGAQVTATDKTREAIMNTYENAHLNGLSIQVIQSDLFRKISDCFDVITFNPPYLPQGPPSDISWDGGFKGIELADRFLREAQQYLKKEGRIYLLLSTRGDIKKLITQYQDIYRFHLIDTLPLFFEKLKVFKITH
jgi:release factor glutamine methyltransferase